MKVFAVIDTNVLVSALLKPGSIPDLVMQEAMGGRIIPVINKDIVYEYKSVLRRAKFGFDGAKVKFVLDEITKRAIFCDAMVIEDSLPDPKDAVFYAVTMEKRTSDDAYLVTGNLRHFPEEPFIVTPREMIEILLSK